MRPRWSGAIRLSLENISVERHSAVEGNKRMRCRLIHSKGRLLRRSERSVSANARAARGTAICVAHRNTA
jgi:non-homologous end joining protein Ku